MTGDNVTNSKEIKENTTEIEHILKLTQIIREVDGSHSLGASELAEKILSHNSIEEIKFSDAPVQAVGFDPVLLSLIRRAMPNLVEKLPDLGVTPLTLKELNERLAQENEGLKQEIEELKEKCVDFIISTEDLKQKTENLKEENEKLERELKEENEKLERELDNALDDNEKLQIELDKALEDWEKNK